MTKLQNILGGGFDSSTVQPSESRDGRPLPAGLYTAEITSSEVKDLKSGNGTGLSLEFTIIDPQEHVKRKVWASLNIKHSSAEAERIGQSQLSALCRAVGIGVLNDSDDLFQRIVKIRTKVRPAQGDYGAKAEVSGFESAGAGAAPSAPAANNTAASAGAPAPWKRKAA